VKVFPDPREATEDGLLCIGGSLDVPTLLQAYSKGIFPWPQEGYPLLWFSPSQRGVLDFSELHLSRTFLRDLKRSDLKFTFNKAFSKVIRACSQIPRSHETGTWILPEMVEAYIAFHKAGHAHSIEAWRDGELVGGLYGVYVGGVFSGESMFYTESNASKLCLYKMILHLKNKGLQWLDTQMVTPLVEKLGGKYISRDEFLDRLKLAQKTSPTVIIKPGETPP
jgi:leucyl/phenylalanyl-tRNA---protein transferase